MLCCPCLPLRKKKKVQSEARLAAPERKSRRWLKRLFNRTKVEDIPPTDSLDSQEPGPVAEDVPQIPKTPEATEEEVPLETPNREVTPDTRPLVAVPRVQEGRQSQAFLASIEAFLVCRGLPNIGQTCYMNAVLQCLFALQPLCTQLLLLENMCEKESSALLLSSFVGLLHLRGSMDRQLKAAVLNELKDSIALRNQEFEGNLQNDAHEFLSECLMGLRDIRHTLQMGGVSYQCPVDTLFSFQLLHTRSCRSCGVESRREETNTCLSLQMVAQGTIHNSLELFFTDTDVEYNCERCGGQVSNLRCSFKTLPQVLILHVSRFCPLTLSKNRAPLKLEPELQTLQRWCSTATTAALSPSEASSSQDLEAGPEREKLEGINSTYLLRAIASHIGTDVNSGHYISDRAFGGGLWATFDDEKTSLSTEAAILEKRASSAYILFYMRKMG